ncbi:GNAT family N-acetyltransferase [Proteiniclasticum sp. SCR006]|uniref:GNAT family N-acetyltransferase n=1 Tax=Proteiniclasticum aestuarii TaxID=2817862 RepID=A0A939H8K1_9CLOT|nr:GNAT family N-acetyltransferase [Proteiniclasticum aestuarii]MBO1263973.1 GNAT family N-acetyltransferase [Proteiniclasticum aestuarii]
MRYVNAQEVGREKIYTAFQKGFSDYRIRFHMTQEEFFERFFGSEGNELSASYVALDGENPVGLVLGGVKDFNGVKTMRCGTLCIAPAYRGKGVSDALFSLHERSAEEIGCRQMFLEVIKGNDRAISFYEKKGYSRIYDLRYYAVDRRVLLEEKARLSEELTMRGMSIEEFFSVKEQVGEVHLNWQTDFQAMKITEDIHYLGVYRKERIIGACAYRTSGKICFIWVHKEERLQGIGASLLQEIARKTLGEKIQMSFSNHMGLWGFVHRLGFREEKLSQYEMVRLL